MHRTGDCAGSGDRRRRIVTGNKWIFCYQSFFSSQICDMIDNTRIMEKGTDMGRYGKRATKTGRAAGRKPILALGALAVLVAVGAAAFVFMHGKKTESGKTVATAPAAEAGRVVSGSAAEAGGAWEDGELRDYEAEGMITLGKYTGIEVEVTPTKEEIYEEIQSRVEKADVKVSGDDEIKKGDYVFLDYTGSADGTELDEEDVVLRAGSDGKMPSLSLTLTGKKVGQTYTAPVTFPDDYEDGELAGSQVNLSITVNGKFDDAYAKKLSKNRYSTVGEYEDYISGELKKENEKDAGEMAFEELMENCKAMVYPQENLKEMREDLENQYHDVAEASGYSYDELLESLQMSDEGIGELAEDTLKERMAAKTIALREGLELTDSLYRKYLMRVEEEKDTDISMEELLKEYRGYYGRWPRDDMYVEMVKDFIGKKAKKK